MKFSTAAHGRRQLGRAGPQHQAGPRPVAAAAQRTKLQAELSAGHNDSTPAFVPCIGFQTLNVRCINLYSCMAAACDKRCFIKLMSSAMMHHAAQLLPECIEDCTTVPTRHCCVHHDIPVNAGGHTREQFICYIYSVMLISYILGFWHAPTVVNLIRHSISAFQWLLHGTATSLRSEGACCWQFNILTALLWLPFWPASVDYGCRNPMVALSAFL